MSTKAEQALIQSLIDHAATCLRNAEGNTQAALNRAVELGDEGLIMTLECAVSNQEVHHSILNELLELRKLTVKKAGGPGTK